MPERAGQPYQITLDADDCGTVLGALAWVLGAIEIMKDRGHAEGDESFHELADELSPRLTALLAKLAQARAKVEGDADGASQGVSSQRASVEEAYTRVRSAFETWIQLTALDTTEIAIEQRLASQDGEEER